MSKIEFEIAKCSNDDCRERFIVKVDVGDSDFKTIFVTCPFCKTQSKIVFEQDNIETIVKGKK